jgi:DNA helicase HerA-like ATPase
MQNYEKLGEFYLGRLRAGEQAPATEELLLYDSKDLTTHAVCVGMTGSGKTGLCITLLEEAALDGVPVLAIDPKGDVGNLLLTFPELRPGDFLPWINRSEADQAGRTPEEHAAHTAGKWKKGLADWGQDGGRIARLRASAAAAIYTPGSTAGIPLKVLRSLAAPPPALAGDADAFRERINASVSGLLTLLGIDADPIRSREHILLSHLVDRAWRDGRDLEIASLIQEIQSPPFDKVGVIDLESFFPSKDRFELSLSLNNLLASPGFAAWMEGEPLDIARLLWTPEAKPKISILSIAHLSETERMFFVTLILNELVAWMRSQPGTTSLRALLYMDEVFGYFPPTANPPSKTPMLTLLKQARAYGLGVVLATQNPVDLDYKGLSNAGTWFIGRLQTERDRARVLDGLEGASAEAGAAFERREIESTLAGLKSRVFFMNNVHEEVPAIFETRWASPTSGVR